MFTSAWKDNGVLGVREQNTVTKATEKFKFSGKQHYKPLLEDLLLKVNNIS